MIYSTTMYYNNEEVLDLKIKEESPYVDKIIVVESLWTHVGNPKPINFPVDKYKDNPKVVHLLIDDESGYRNCDMTDNRFSRITVERNYPFFKLPIEDDDVFIVLDIDEILNGEKIPQIVEETRKWDFVRLDMRTFCYYINVESKFNTGGITTEGNLAKWAYPYGATGRKCKEAGGDLTLLRVQSMGPILPNCGHHFTYLGGFDKIVDKMKNAAHTELNNPEFLEGVKQRFENLDDITGRQGKDLLEVIEIDELYPKTIRENISAWQKYIFKKEAK